MTESRRYVLLRHTMPPESARGSHWDLMIEDGERLATWAASVDPRKAKEFPVQALPPHRAAYLEYEGPVSGDRGDVRRCEAGQCVVLEQSPERWRVAFRSIVESDADVSLAGATLQLDAQSDASWLACRIGNSDDEK